MPDESEFYGEDELWKIVDENDCVDGQMRPNFLDLASNFGNTPVVSRKPTFQFTGEFYGFAIFSATLNLTGSALYKIFCCFNKL